jgi:hypothetical protein
MKVTFTPSADDGRLPLMLFGSVSDEVRVEVVEYLGGLLIVPPETWHWTIAFVTVLSGVFSCHKELNGAASTAWSKFRVAMSAADESETLKVGLAGGGHILPTNCIDTRGGMMCVFAAPILVHYSATNTAWYIEQLNLVDWELPPWTTYHWICEAVVFGYLLRRFLEVLLLHEYSKDMPNSIVKGLVTHFCIAIGFLNFYILQTEAKPHTVAASDQAMYAGCGIFIVSQIESVRHHAILRGLRESAAVVGTPHTKKRGRDKGALYHIPKGGLFDACACPHYMYEAVGWFAIAVCVRHLYAWALAVQMTLILMGRAFRTRNWYREKFDDYPASMAAFIPYIL